MSFSFTGCSGCGEEGEPVCVDNGYSGDDWGNDNWDSWDDWGNDWGDSDWDDDSGDDSGDDDSGGWGDDDWNDDCYSCGDDWGWYDDAQVATGNHSTDIMGDVASVQNSRLNRASAFYTNKFNLSEEQGKKLAKTLQDFQLLKKRTGTDLVEFSQKLYGLNPEEIITSVSAAQVGNNAELDKLINKAAKNFETTSQNMRKIIKTIHKSVLKENGIEL